MSDHVPHLCPESADSCFRGRISVSGHKRNRHRSKQHPYSITSSALTRISDGIASPSDAAVFAFTTNSNFTGCSTGKSAGFSPLSILVTIIPLCRHIDVKTGP